VKIQLNDKDHLKKLAAGRPGKIAGLLAVVLIVNIAFAACSAGTAKDAVLSDYTADGTGTGQTVSAAGSDPSKGLSTAVAGSSISTKGAASGSSASSAQTGSGPAVSTSQNTPASQNASASEAATVPNPMIGVYVCGAVRKPGVYSLPEGARVIEAVRAAGGFAEEADVSYINQATVLKDADQVRIPTLAETGNGVNGVNSASSTAVSAARRPAASSSGTSGKAAATPAAGTGTAAVPASPDPGITPGTVSSSGNGTTASDGTGNVRVNINTATSEQLQGIPGIGPAKAALIIQYREENGPFASPEDLMNISGIKQGLYSKVADYITVE
jgi:competence protein ComEA